MKPMDEKEALSRALDALRQLRESPHFFISESAKVMCSSLEGILELFSLTDISSKKGGEA